MASERNISVFDLQNFPNQSSKLIAAIEQWACFRLLNYHQVLPSTLMSEMKAIELYSPYADLEIHKAADLLKILSLYSQSKTLEIPEPTKKVQHSLHQPSGDNTTDTVNGQN
ncbi:hypothetical protein R6Q59_018438 [Mikania micrantha]